MQKIGRNDPCPCGSGKKHKQCCLSQLTTMTHDIDPLWIQLRSAIEPVFAELSKFSRSYLPSADAAIEAAWVAFIPAEVKDSHPFSDGPHLPVFISWFHYHWYPQLADAVSPQTLAHAYLKKKHYALPNLAIKYIEQCLISPFSFAEVISVKPGQGVLMRDIFTGEIIDVVERMGSAPLQPDDILLAKIIQIDHLHVFEALAPFSFPPSEKAPILALRQLMQAEHTSLTSTHLKDYEREILDIYYFTTERLFKPVMPKLKNTDGDDILFHTLVYDIDSAEEAFDALKHLCISANEQELLEDALFDETGKLSEVEFPWQKKGNKTNKTWTNTILGYIKLTPDTLTIEVNSAQRAKKWQALIKQLLAEKARYKTSTTQSPDTALEKVQEKNKADEATLKRKQEIDDLNAQPEVQAQINEHLREHYRTWLKQKIPALDHKTPLQAVKTKDGKEMVEALLVDIERSIKRMCQNADSSIVNELRTSLGLAKNKPVWLDTPSLIQ